MCPCRNSDLVRPGARWKQQGWYYLVGWHPGGGIRPSEYRIKQFLRQVLKRILLFTDASALVEEGGRYARVHFCQVYDGRKCGRRWSPGRVDAFPHGVGFDARAGTGAPGKDCREAWRPEKRKSHVF